MGGLVENVELVSGCCGRSAKRLEQLVRHRNRCRCVEFSMEDAHRRTHVLCAAHGRNGREGKAGKKCTKDAAGRKERRADRFRQSAVQQMLQKNAAQIREAAVADARGNAGVVRPVFKDCRGSHRFSAQDDRSGCGFRNGVDDCAEVVFFVEPIGAGAASRFAVGAVVVCDNAVAPRKIFVHVFYLAVPGP